MIVRKILRMIGSRYGIAAMLLLLVVGVVAVAKANSTPGDSDATTGSDDAEQTVEPSGPDDGRTDPPGEDASDDVPSLPDEAVDVALSFAEAWVDVDKSQADWHSGISRYANEDVQKQLENTDPGSVPAAEISEEEPNISGNWVEVDTDTGLLRLLMNSDNEKWLVAEIDFQY
ncbi:MAG: hypothetical protein ACRDXX_18140 [Stackebrandtia sp.]